MELVVDTNILYTYFWEKSLARRFLMKMYLKLFSPEFALEEINSNEADILKKTGLSKKEFNDARSNLAIAVEFVPLEEYEKFLKPALKFSPDPNDVDFLALAMKLKLPLWSNDSGLKKQSKVEILSTLDLLSKPEFSDVLFPDE
ncbi:MAG: PIN domain-containing protein [Nanoarchaeota archaeon]